MAWQGRLRGCWKGGENTKRIALVVFAVLMVVGVYPARGYAAVTGTTYYPIADKSTLYASGTVFVNTGRATFSVKFVDGTTAGPFTANIGITGSFTAKKVDYIILVHEDGNSPTQISLATQSGGAGTKYAVPLNSGTTEEPIPDTTPPVAPGLLTAVAGDGSALLKWTASGSSDLNAYRIYKGETLVGTVAKNVLEYQLAQLVNGTSYTYSVAAVDVAGNESTRASVSFTPSAPKDEEPPTAPTLSGEGVKDGFNLSWTASTDNVGVVGYNLYDSGLKVNSTLITGLTYQIRGMPENLTKSFIVRAQDAQGNQSAASNTVKLTVPDFTPPDTPTLSGTAGNQTASLTWTPSQASDLAGYNIYRNGTKQNSDLILTRLYTDQSLVNGTRYTYQVSAVDKGGLESPKSNSVALTPQLREMETALVPNGTSIIVRIQYGQAPYKIELLSPAAEYETKQTVHYITGLSLNASYTVRVTDAAGTVFSGTVNTGEKVSLVPPILPDSDETMQKMVNGFTEAGRIGIVIIGGAVSLGVIVILARWAFRMTKRWLARAK